MRFLTYPQNHHYDNNTPFAQRSACPTTTLSLLGKTKQKIFVQETRYNNSLLHLSVRIQQQCRQLSVRETP